MVERMFIVHIKYNHYSKHLHVITLITINNFHALQLHLIANSYLILSTEVGKYTKLS